MLITLRKMGDYLLPTRRYLLTDENNVGRGFASQLTRQNSTTQFTSDWYTGSLTEPPQAQDQVLARPGCAGYC